MPRRHAAMPAGKGSPRHPALHCGLADAWRSAPHLYARGAYDSGPGRGIAQWSAGGRWDSDQGDNLVAFASQEGQSPYSLDVQLDFIMYELQTFPDYGLAKLKASTNVTDATTDFELDFEGCGIPS